MRCLAIIAAAIVAVAGGAAADPLTPNGFLRLTYGQRAVLHLDDAGRIVVDKVQAGGMGDASKDHIIVSLGDGLHGGTMMVVSSGYSATLSYHALTVRGADEQPTSVCTLIPHGADVESWPDKFDAILVGGFSKTDSKREVCQ